MEKKRATDEASELKFISIGKHPELMNTFHKWEVLTPLVGIEATKYWIETFMPDEYKKPEDQYEALMDYLRGCRFSDTEYYVFVDDRLVMDL